MDDIVIRLRNEAIKETDDGICYSCGGNFQTVTHYSGCVVLTVSEAADEIERLRSDVDRWKSLCERILDYKLGSSDWQEIRVSYEMALEDYNA